MPWDCHCDVMVGHSAGCGYWTPKNQATADCQHLTVSSVTGFCLRCGVLVLETPISKE